MCDRIVYAKERNAHAMYKAVLALAVMKQAKWQLGTGTHLHTISHCQALQRCPRLAVGWNCRARLRSEIILLALDVCPPTSSSQRCEV